MSHDLYATWATTEIVRTLKQNPSDFFVNRINSEDITAYANRESGRSWPIPDGRISVGLSNKDIEFAIELKRENEGLHGVLTAIGQSQAYLHKGYHSSIIVIPRDYCSYSNPGAYISEVINKTNPEIPIGVFSYLPPDTTLTSPFQNKIQCHRAVGFDLNKPVVPSTSLLTAATNTQWAHLREGSSESHAFFKYLQMSKRVSSNDSNQEPDISHLPIELINAVGRISSGSALNYLSNATGTSLHDIIWRSFWFENILNKGVSTLWSASNPYILCDSPSSLFLDDGSPKMFFSGRIDSIKNKLIQQLNSNQIDENKAWEEFAKNIKNRAHSYREDIDSGLCHLGFLEDDGRPTDLGYRFVDVCERTKDYYSGQAKMILGSAILKNGDLAALLHYFYKISEAKFNADPFAFSQKVNERYSFKRDEYLDYIRNVLANELNVMNTASSRGGQARKAFQGELAVLCKFGFVGEDSHRFRLGNGLLINWPLVQEYLNFEL